MHPQPGLLQAPPLQRRVHLVQAGEGPPPPEGVAHVGHRPLHPRLVPGVLRPGRVDEAAVVLRQLGVAPVEARVVQVGAHHPALEVVRHQAPGRGPEEGEGGRRGTPARCAGRAAAPPGRTGAGCGPAPARRRAPGAGGRSGGRATAPGPRSPPGPPPPAAGPAGAPSPAPPARGRRAPAGSGAGSAGSWPGRPAAAPRPPARAAAARPWSASRPPAAPGSPPGAPPAPRRWAPAGCAPAGRGGWRPARPPSPPAAPPRPRGRSRPPRPGRRTCGSSCGRPPGCGPIGRDGPPAVPVLQDLGQVAHGKAPPAHRPALLGSGTTGPAGTAVRLVGWGIT